MVSPVSLASGREPIVMGKPAPNMFEVLRKVHNLDPSRCMMVGDRLGFVFLDYLYIFFFFLIYILLHIYICFGFSDISMSIGLDLSPLEGWSALDYSFIHGFFQTGKQTIP